MRSIARALLAAAVGLTLIACFNTTKTEHVTPGVTNPQPQSCQPRGGVCRTNDDCCSLWCVNGTCVTQ
jgi:hypothetical protein